MLIRVGKHMLSVIHLLSSRVTVLGHVSFELSFLVEHRVATNTQE